MIDIFLETFFGEGTSHGQQCTDRKDTASFSTLKRVSFPPKVPWHVLES